MRCFIYRSTKKHNTYLFLPKKDDFSEVPDTLMKLFGEAEYSFDFDLNPGKKLVMAEAAEVLRNISENGFFLQLPPGDSKLEKVH